MLLGCLGWKGLGSPNKGTGGFGTATPAGFGPAEAEGAVPSRDTARRKGVGLLGMFGTAERGT